MRRRSEKVSELQKVQQERISELEARLARALGETRLLLADRTELTRRLLAVLEAASEAEAGGSLRALTRQLRRIVGGGPAEKDEGPPKTAGEPPPRPDETGE